MYDNTFLMDNDPGYVRTLEALPEIRKRAMLYGDWNSFEGMFFPEFDEAKHVIPDLRPSSDWVKFRALDYGLDMTACLWIAVTPERRCVVYRELCKPDLILSEAAAAILKATPENENIRYTVASPDLWNRRQDSGKSGVQIMTEAGLKGLRRADNARIPGWRVVREYLRPGAENGIPRLHITQSCRELIRCLPSLAFDPDVTEDASDKPHEITHAPEALRYALMSREPRCFIPKYDVREGLYSFGKRKRGEDGDEFSEC